MSSKFRFQEQKSLFPDFGPTKVFCLAKSLILSDAPAVGWAVQPSICPCLLWFCLAVHNIHLVHLTFPARGFVCFGPQPRMVTYLAVRVVKS